MKLRNKFLLYMLIPILISVCAGLVGTYVNSLLSKEFTYLSGNLVPALTQLGELKSSANALRDLVISEDLLTSGYDSADSYTQKYLRSHLAVFKSNSHYYASLEPGSASDPSVNELYRLSESLLHQYQQLVTGSTGDRSQFRQEINKATQRLNSLIDLRVKIEVVALNEREAIARGQLSRLSRFNIIALAIAFTLAYTIALLLASALVTPIVEMRDIAAEFGQGRLNNRIEVRGADELSELGESLNQMATDLAARTVSKEYVDGIVNSMATMLLVLDRSGVIQTVNPAFCRQLGYQEAEILGTHVVTVLPESKDYLVTDGQGRIISFASDHAFEAHLVASSGEQRLGTLHLAEVEGADLGSRRIVCVIQDITERRELENERTAFREHLRHAEQLASLGTMSAIVAHRLRQPLTSTYLFLQDTMKELALAKPNLETVTSSVHWSLQEVERASGIIKNVLAFAHSATAEQIESCGVADTLERVVGVLKDKADAVKMRVTLKGSSDVTIEAYPGDLQQVAFTIIQNAVQAASSRESSALVIDWKTEGEEIVLRFSDNCGGIPEENIDQIFDLFFSTKPIGEGTGLGLCIVQQIVSRLEGEVSVESQYPIGASFIVRLPIRVSSRFE